VRLALFGAAVGTVLAIPGLARAGDPRLLFEVRPPATVVLESGGRRDALLTIDVQNPGDRRVRVESLRLTYLERDVAVGTFDPATSLFTRADLPPDPVIEAGGRELWPGLCLAPPTRATDHLRLEFGLVERRGLRFTHATQVLDLPLRPPVAPPVIALPVVGTWRVTQGHACNTNHRRGRLGGEFAWDLAAVSEAGRSGAPGFDTSHRNDQSATFGRPVISPVRGTVVSVIDGIDDNDAQREFPRRSLVESVRAPRWIFGNHIVLDAGRGVFVLLAHLRKDSVAVKPGASVGVGDPLARAGNSGNTMLPHVHVQVMDGADPADPAVSGIPALFRDYVEVSASGTKPQREAIVRRVAAGDPPEGSVVVTTETAQRAP
jgi:peptidase M23-like protein